MNCILCIPCGVSVNIHEAFVHTVKSVPRSPKEAPPQLERCTSFKTELYCKTVYSN